MQFLRGERVEFAGRRGNILVGDVHRPSSERCPWLLLCHGMESTRGGTKQLAMVERFLPLGVGILRFDFSYVGDSEGNFEDLTLSGEVEDALGAMDFLLGFEPGPCVMVGSSLGGMVALKAATILGGQLSGVATLAAVAESSLFLRGVSEADREQWRSSGSRPWGDASLRSSFLDDAEGFELLTRLPSLQLPTLIMHGDADTVVPVEQAHSLAAAAAGPVREVIFPGVGHRFEEPGALKELLDTLHDWLVGSVGFELA